MANNDPTAQLVQDARQLTHLASEGGLHIRLLPPQLPATSIATSNTHAAGTAASSTENASKHTDRYGVVLAISMILAPALGIFMHSFLAGVVAYFVFAVIFALMQNAVLRRLTHKWLGKS